MPRIPRAQIARTVRQRCFWLFLALLLLIVLGPLAVMNARGRAFVEVAGAVILFLAIFTTEHGTTTRLVAIVLAVGALLANGLAEQLALPLLLPVSEALILAFFALTTVHLLAYVFRRNVMTEDKLYGAAAAFLMLGVAWAYVYSLLLRASPGALVGVHEGASFAVDLVYFSFTVLTTTGFGDIVPVAPIARMLVVVEEIAGVLFVAILIARIAGVYAGASGGAGAAGAAGDQPTRAR